MPTTQEMLNKLNELYNKREQLIKHYRQNEEDIEMLQLLIMYQSNKENR